jgi:hypothetical protein
MIRKNANIKLHYQTLSGENSKEISESSSRLEEDLGDLEGLLINFLCKGLFRFGLSNGS